MINGFSASFISSPAPTVLSSLNVLVRELAVIKLGVESALAEKLLVPSLFDYVAVTHYEDNVSLAYSRKPVRNDKARSALHHCEECLLDLHLGARVDR